MSKEKWKATTLIVGGKYSTTESALLNGYLCTVNFTAESPKTPEVYFAFIYVPRTDVRACRSFHSREEAKQWCEESAKTGKANLKGENNE